MINCNKEIFRRVFLPTAMFFAVLIGSMLLAFSASAQVVPSEHICDNGGNPIRAQTSDGIPAYDNVCPCMINGNVQNVYSTDGVQMYSDTVAHWVKVNASGTYKELSCEHNPVPVPKGAHLTDTVGYQCMELAARYFHFIHHKDIGAGLGDDFCPKWWPRDNDPGLKDLVSQQPALPKGVHYVPRTDISSDLGSYVLVKPHKGDAIVYNWNATRNTSIPGGGWYGPITSRPGNEGASPCFYNDASGRHPCIGDGHIAIVDSEMDANGNFTVVQQNPRGSKKTENINNPYICTFIHAGLVGYPTQYCPAKDGCKIIDVACLEEAKINPLPIGTFDKHPSLDPNQCGNTAIWATDADNTYSDPHDGTTAADNGAIVSSPSGGYTDMELARRYACFAWTNNSADNNICSGVDLTDVNYPSELAIKGKPHKGTKQYYPPKKPNKGDLAIYTPKSAKYAMDAYKVDCTQFLNVKLDDPHGHIGVVNRTGPLLTVNATQINPLSMLGLPDKTLHDITDQQNLNKLGGSASQQDACVDTYVCAEGSDNCPPSD